MGAATRVWNPNKKGWPGGISVNVILERELGGV
jgi:hypothetical protein